MGGRSVTGNRRVWLAGLGIAATSALALCDAGDAIGNYPEWVEGARVVLAAVLTVGVLYWLAARRLAAAASLVEQTTARWARRAFVIAAAVVGASIFALAEVSGVPAGVAAGDPEGALLVRMVMADVLVGLCLVVHAAVPTRRRGARHRAEEIAITRAILARSGASEQPRPGAGGSGGSSTRAPGR